MLLAIQGKNWMLHVEMRRVLSAYCICRTRKQTDEGLELLPVQEGS